MGVLARVVPPRALVSCQLSSIPFAEHENMVTKKHDHMVTENLVYLGTPLPRRANAGMQNNPNEGVRRWQRSTVPIQPTF